MMLVYTSPRCNCFATAWNILLNSRRKVRVVVGWVPGAHSTLFRIRFDIRLRSSAVHLHCEIEIRWSESIDCICWMVAMWKADTLMQAMCFCLVFIFVRKRSIRFIAMKNTSEDKSYITFRHLSTWADLSRAPIVNSSSWNVQTSVR